VSAAVTGSERIEAAFSPDGARDTPAVICYEGIFVRDHWSQLTRRPWWEQLDPDVERQAAWRCEVIEQIGQDWLVLPSALPRAQRAGLSLQVRPEGVVRLDARTGIAEPLAEPQVGGWSPAGELASVQPEHLAETPDEIDHAIALPASDPGAAVADGRGDLAARLQQQCGRGLWPLRHVSSPLWRCYSLWGFEGMMAMAATRPDLVRHACLRYLESSVRAVREAAALGAAGIWIEECLTDMVSPETFRALNLPFLRPLVEEIRRAGLKSIYYYCGDPWDRWDLLMDAGADALSLEEGKKGFEIDVDDVVARTQWRCVVLGNLDAIGVLQDGSDDALRAEIARQLAAGHRNGGRFIMSLGSPVTPETSVARVRRYCDLVRELSG
jgi:hypothetical protein